MSIANRRAAEDSVTESCGNVFADLGLADPETLLAKSALAIHIKRAIEARNLTQREAAVILGLDQPKVSAITKGHLAGYSTDRLVRFLNILGCDVQIAVSPPHPETPGRIVFA